MPPFQHTNPAIVISQHLSSEPPAIGAKRPELVGLGPVFAKALARMLVTATSGARISPVTCAAVW